MTENELTLHNPVVESSQEDLPTSSPSGSTNSALCKVSTSEDSTSPSQCALEKEFTPYRVNLTPGLVKPTMGTVFAEASFKTEKEGDNRIASILKSLSDQQ